MTTDPLFALFAYYILGSTRSGGSHTIITHRLMLKPHVATCNVHLCDPGPKPSAVPAPNPQPLLLSWAASLRERLRRLSTGRDNRASCPMKGGGRNISKELFTD